MSFDSKTRLPNFRRRRRHRAPRRYSGASAWRELWRPDRALTTCVVVTPRPGNPHDVIPTPHSPLPHPLPTNRVRSAFGSGRPFRGAGLLLLVALCLRRARDRPHCGIPPRPNGCLYPAMRRRIRLRGAPLHPSHKQNNSFPVSKYQSYFNFFRLFLMLG